MLGTMLRKSSVLFLIMHDCVSNVLPVRTAFIVCPVCVVQLLVLLVLFWVLYDFNPESVKLVMKTESIKSKVQDNKDLDFT